MMINPLTSRRPSHLGIHRGRLAACPSTSNCVSSQADDSAHYVAPLAAHGFNGFEMMERLTSALQACEEVRVITATEFYLHVECRSPLMGLVDDLEFMWSEHEQACHVRSASRLGMTDFGKNRARIEKLRRLLEGWGFCD